MTRLLSILGSGETSPTMVKPHREVFERLSSSAPNPDISVPSVFLDTPFGFQENADELSVKTVDYFNVSLNRIVEVAGLREIEALTTLEREVAYNTIRQARFVFAGPGSPTYALRQWAGTPLPELLAEKLQTDGAVTFSSAAALTLGVSTVPVYEIYKSGADPYWLEGLDLLTPIGLPVAVIPHYNNTEGGHHDTRFCYLGERRLRKMEEFLPKDAFVLGVDEHTGVILDLDADTAKIVGLGVVTIRRNGVSLEIPTGETVSIDVLREGPKTSSGTTTKANATSSEPVIADTSGASTSSKKIEASLANDVDRCSIEFDRSMEQRDAAGAVAATLDLDDAIRGWSSDTLQSDEMEKARALLRSMIVRLGEASQGGLTDPRTVLGPVVEIALLARAEVRLAKLYDLSDQIRDGLAAAGVEVRDTAEGQIWDLISPG
ncbi:MAG: hypothetical protein WEA11_07905 [Acidimicrobiales bacterium]